MACRATAVGRSGIEHVRQPLLGELLFDEAQDFDPDLEIEVTQIQAASPMPVTIFAGTARSGRPGDDPARRSGVIASTAMSKVPSRQTAAS